MFLGISVEQHRYYLLGDQAKIVRTKKKKVKIKQVNKETEHR